MKDDEQIRAQIRFHKALSNPERLRIVQILLDGELCQCDIFPKMGLAQSTVSSYLSQLVRAGLLDVRRDGQRKLYSIADNSVVKLLKNIRTTITGVTV